MFHLKVEKKDAEELSAAGNLDISRKIFENGSIRITTVTDNENTFYLCLGPIIIIGEAQRPLREPQILKAYGLMETDARSLVADGSIQMIAAVNTSDGSSRIFRSISYVRTIYLRQDQRGFSCASHLRFFRDDGVRLEINDAMLPEFLIYRYIIPPLTLFKDIKSVPGGWEASYDPKSGMTYRNHWDLTRDERVTDAAEAVENVHALFQKTFGALKGIGSGSAVLLSGGVDSSILGALSHQCGITDKSYSSGFQAITGDHGESEYAKTAAKAIGLDHTVYDVTGDDYLSGLIDSISAAEEPVHHLQSVVLGSLFAKGVSPDIAYLFNGEGADGLFGNYWHLNYWKSRKFIPFTDRKMMRPILGRMANLILRMGKENKYFDHSHSADHDSMEHWLWSIEAWGDLAWIRQYFNVGMPQTITSRKLCMDNYRSWSLPDKVTALCLNGDIDETLKVWGKIGEANGKTIVFPFTHPEIVSYIFKVAWSVKAREPKYVLRNLARKLGIPDEIITRPKKSFGFPIKYWALPGTTLQPLVDMAGEMFDPATLKSLQNIRQEKAMILWGMLNIYLWKKIFTDGVTTKDLKEEMGRRRVRSKVAV